MELNYSVQQGSVQYFETPRGVTARASLTLKDSGQAIATLLDEAQAIMARVEWLAPEQRPGFLTAAKAWAATQDYLENYAKREGHEDFIIGEYAREVLATAEREAQVKGPLDDQRERSEDRVGLAAKNG